MAWKDVDSLLPPMRPGLFWVLLQAYRYLLKGKPMRNVGPVPEFCEEARLVNVEDKKMLSHRDTLLKHIEPCRVAEATEAKVIDEWFRDQTRETAADVRTTLQGLLMKRERSKRRDGMFKLVNVDLYKFAFESGTSWVKLVQ